MLKLKQLAKRVLLLPMWLWLLFSLSLIGGSRVREAREEQQRQARRIQLDEIEVAFQAVTRESDQLESELKQAKARGGFKSAAQQAAFDGKVAALRAEIGRIQLRAKELRQTRAKP